MSDHANREYDLAASQPARMRPPHAGAPATPPDLRQTDVICLNCAYNLRGLDPAGKCPECGTPVARSLHGNLLVFSAPEYLRRLQRGIVFILIAVILQLAAAIGVIGLMVAIPQSQQGLIGDFQQFIAVGISALSLLGWWLFSEPDPAILGQEKGDGPRKVIRAAVIISAGCTLLGLASNFAIRQTASANLVGSLSRIIAGVAWLVTFFASMMYVRWLSPRIPSRDLYTQAGRYMWLIPLIYVLGMCLFFIGPLVAAIMYYIMLNNIRIILNTIRERQARDFPAVA